MGTVAISLDDKYAAAGSLDGVIALFDLAQKKLVRTIEGHSDVQIPWLVECVNLTVESNIVPIYKRFKEDCL